MTETVSGKTAFVTGASRGIGAETAKALAKVGYDVALGYQDPKKEKRVRAVIEEIKGLGREAIAVRGDITSADDRKDITRQLEAWSGLNALVLNAAGGLEKSRVDADPDYPLKINYDAQESMVLDQLHLLRPDSSVVFVTSHWAHKAGEVELPPFDYEPIATSKHLGEMALRNYCGERLATIGSRLLVVTAGVVTGTFVGDMGLKRFPEFAQKQQAMSNIIPVELVGRRIAQVIEDPSLPSGHTEWIGANEAIFMEQSGG